MLQNMLEKKKKSSSAPLLLAALHIQKFKVIFEAINLHYTSNLEFFLKMRAAFLHNLREDGGRKSSSHFDEKLILMG